MMIIERKHNILFMTAKGKLNDDDYDQVLPVLRNMIDEYDKIKWFIKLEEFEGWTPHAFWREISFALSNRMNLDKVAVIGKNEWHESMAEVMELFSATHIEYFDEKREEEAINWIQS